MMFLKFETAEKKMKSRWFNGAFCTVKNALRFSFLNAYLVFDFQRVKI